MRQPTFTQANLSALRQNLMKQNKLQSLERDEAIPVMTSGSQPLDWVTDCGGLPRGRVVQMKGPESSGKCVSFDTFIPVFGQGLIQMKELVQQVDWRVGPNDQVIPDQHQSFTIRVPGSNGEPVNSTDIYFAGHLPTYKITTEDGHELTGAKEHRVLALTSSGLIAYTMLRDVRLGTVLVKSMGQRVTGPQEKIWEWDLPADSHTLTFREAATASFFGALCSVEFRDNYYYLLVNHPYQIKLVKQWAQDMTGDPEIDPFDETVSDFSRFSGLARIRSGKWSEMARNALVTVPAMIRQASLTAQAHWCAGLTLTRGTWTSNDLEFEIQSHDVAQTLHLLMENIGVRCTLYPTLNTFASEMTKVAIRDRIAQQNAEDLIWRGYVLPPDWRGCCVGEDTETHLYVRETLNRAKEILTTEGKKDLADRIDTEDLDKENLWVIAEQMSSLARQKKTIDRIYEAIILLASPNTYLDRVTLAKASPLEEPLADLRIPIGSHYATNNLISHNSTLALHYARQELETHPQSVVVYQDYEHSMTVRYARKILQRNFDRFFLIPSDSFEEVDKYLTLFFSKYSVSPALWIIDSVPAMVPQAMWGNFSQQGDDEDDDDGKKKKGEYIGLQARLFSKDLAIWVKVAGAYGTTFLMLNQIRASIKINKFEKTDGSDRGSAGLGENSPGGYALRFYNSLTMDLRPRMTLKAEIFNPMLQEKEMIPIANSVQIKVTKNKCGAPQRSCMIYIQYGEGVDDTRTIFDLSISRGLIKNPSQGIFSLDLPDAQSLSVKGRENFINALKGKTHGNLGPLAVTHLKTLLQWDRADEIHAQVLGLKEEDVESGELTTLEGELDPGILTFIRTLKTYAEKADALDLLIRRKKSVYWKNPMTGEEISCRSLDKLMDKMSDDDIAIFVNQIKEKIAYLESKLPPVTLEPAAPPSESFADPEFGMVNGDGDPGAPEGLQSLADAGEGWDGSGEAGSSQGEWDGSGEVTEQVWGEPTGGAETVGEAYTPEGAYTVEGETVGDFFNETAEEFPSETYEPGDGNNTGV